MISSQKIAVIGAGIVGITTAYELASDGHQVTVLERRGAAAEEASFANAGVIAPGYVTPWAAPGMPWKVFKHLLSRHAPVKLGLHLGGHHLPWVWRWLRASNAVAYAANRSAMQQLARYSKERLHHVTANAQLEYDRSQGYMVLLRAESDRKLIAPSLQVLKDSGVAFKELDAAGARQVEPALNPDTQFHSAIHLPDDEAGNCRQFVLLLKNELVQRGATVEFGKTVSKIGTASSPTVASSSGALSAGGSGPGVQLHLKGESVPRHFDAVVVCAGLESAALLKPLLQPLGLRLPMAAVYGYSVSANIKEPLNAPRSAVMDERYKVAISRLGQRVRVAGSAELGGHPSRINPSAVQTLYKVLHDWFPGAAVHSSGVQVWKGARPMLPDGPPVIGASGVPDVWLNTGHGSSGWALSCGSARSLADLLGGRQPALDLTGFSIARFA